MTNIVFAQPRHEYASYQDLRQLIALSDFPLVYYDEIEPDSDNVYILIIRNGEMENGFPQSRARIIGWDLEYRRAPEAPVPGVPEWWHMDKAQAEMLGYKYVPVGSHVGLVPEYHNFAYDQHRFGDDPRRYDVAFIGYFDGVPRRQIIRHQLRAAGVKVSPPGAWGSDRDALLLNSRAYLHVHQHEDIPAVPGLRMVVAAAYKLPVLTETVHHPGVFDHNILTADYSILAQCVDTWINDKPHQYMWGEYGAKLHQFLCHELTFRKSVEAAL